MFVYYFLSHRDEDLEFLLSSLKGDPQKLNHLENIRRSMKRETVSMNRLGQTMAANPQIVREIVSNFVKKFNPNLDAAGWKDQAQDIRQKILKSVENDQDKEILDMMVRFNEAVVKTNFFKVPKTSISFRIDPHLLQWEKTYPDVPFGIFLFVGNDFHGFHVRFNDIARGGLRLVLSRDKPSFNRNMETTFFENYNLAHTQNRKNKGALSRISPWGSTV
jgi:glutamate dehydrogenase